jgi:uncharacterized protein involved in tolerance to divalent cations
MITATIYISNTHNPEEVIDKLIKEQLIAFATHDLGVTVYRNENGITVTENVNVLYIETKSLLYTELTEHLNTYYLNQYHLFSCPIIQYSEDFMDVIKVNVKKA